MPQRTKRDLVNISLAGIGIYAGYYVTAPLKSDVASVLGMATGGIVGLFISAVTQGRVLQWE